MKNINGINFQPWVGKHFGESKYGRLLLLGESHYLTNKYGTDEEGSTFTKDVIKNHLKYKEEMETPYFRTIDKLFDTYYEDLWDYIAFANLIQTGLDIARSQPTFEDRSSVIPTFQLLLNNLKPDKVIVLSKRMWQYWLYDIPTTTQVTAIDDNKGQRSEIWRYTYECGSCLAMGMTHPSRLFGNSYQLWQPIVKKFLKMK